MIAVGALFTVMALLPALLILWQRLQVLNKQLQDVNRAERATRGVPAMARAINAVALCPQPSARVIQVTRQPQAWRVVDIEAERIEVK